MWWEEKTDKMLRMLRICHGRTHTNDTRQVPYWTEKGRVDGQDDMHRRIAATRVVSHLARSDTPNITWVVSRLARSDTPNITWVVTPWVDSPIRPTTTVGCISSLHAYSYIQQSCRSIKTMNGKNTKKITDSRECGREQNLRFWWRSHQPF